MAGAAATIIADLNHNIRNALQHISLVSDQQGFYAEVAPSMKRITQALEQHGVDLAELEEDLDAQQL